MILGNLLLISVILSQKKLRRKEFFTMSGLAFGDLIYGIWAFSKYKSNIFSGFGLFSSGIRRIQLYYEGSLFSLVSAWHCMKEIHSTLFIVGSQAGSFMLVVVSLDRLLAVKWYHIYMHLGVRYAFMVLGIVYGYVLFTIPAVFLLSALATDGSPSTIAMCFSTAMGPHWFAFYQPSVQMGGGIVSIIIFIFTWFFFRKHVQNQAAASQETLKRQIKLTRTVGITVLVTFFSFVIPHGTIIIMGLVGEPRLAQELNPYAWMIGNLNNISNIFILGIHNGEIRPILKRWFCSFCTKNTTPQSQVGPSQATGQNRKNFLTADSKRDGTRSSISSRKS